MWYEATASLPQHAAFQQTVFDKYKEYSLKW